MRILISTILLIALASQRAAGDEFDEPPDTKVKGGARITNWTPAILAMYVRHPSSAPPAGAPKPVEAPPTLKEAWNVVKNEVKIPTGAIREDAPIYSGWRVDLSGDDAGLGFESHVVRKPEDHLVTFLLHQETELFFGVDVLMSFSEEERKEKFKHFYFDERQIEVWHVTTNPDQPRAAVEPGLNGPMGVDSAAVQGEHSDKPVQFAPLPIVNPVPHLRFRWSTPGIYEVRVRYTIRGRLNSDEPFATKKLQGAVRFAVRDSGVEFKQLTMDRDNRRGVPPGPGRQRSAKPKTSPVPETK